MPETFFGSPASRVWSAGTSDSDFELCILLEEEKFYKVLLVEIRHLIRLTSISRRVDKITSKQVISSMDNV